MTGFISKPKTPFGEIASEPSTTRHASTSPEYKLKYSSGDSPITIAHRPNYQRNDRHPLFLARQIPGPNPNPVTFGLRDHQFIECVKQVQR